MIKRQDLFAIADSLASMPYLKGQVETKVDLGVSPSEQDLLDAKDAARVTGFHVEDESHEVEGRHMLTCTWKF